MRIPVRFPSREEFDKRFQEESQALHKHLVNRVNIRENFDPIDAIIQYCVLTHGLNAMERLLERAGIPKSAIEELDLEMYEWKVETLRDLKKKGL